MRDADDGWVAVEMKHVATIDAVEQLTRYLERLADDPGFASCRGVLAAAMVRLQQARVLAESRGIDCVEVDPGPSCAATASRSDPLRGVAPRKKQTPPPGALRLPLFTSRCNGPEGRERRGDLSGDAGANPKRRRAAAAAAVQQFKSDRNCPSTSGHS